MKKSLPKLLMLVLALGIATALWFEHSFIKIGSTKLRVLKADSPQEWTRGLLGRDSLGENTGMLFIFEEPGKTPFHMKGMRFPIDIIWIDEHGLIIGIEKNLPPEPGDTVDEKLYYPPQEVKYVLEVNANWTTENNVQKRARVEGL